MIVLVALTLFNFIQNSDFSNSVIFKIIEYVAVFSIIGASGSEFLMLSYSLWVTLRNFFSRKKKKSTVLDDKNKKDIQGGKNKTGTNPEGENHKARGCSDEEDSRAKFIDGRPLEEDSFTFPEKGIWKKQRAVIRREFSGIGNTSGLDDGENRKKNRMKMKGRRMRMGIQNPRRSRVKVKRKIKFGIIEKGERD